MSGILITLFIFASFLAYIKLNVDKLRRYRDVLGLEKANLVYANDYQKVRDLIIPTRQTVFEKTEPVIWLYRAEGLQIFLGANRRSDVRIWIEPQTALIDVHIVLDSTLNNSIRSNLDKKKLPKHQVDLEGNFSKHFRLYCNEGQEVIALQIISPDVMAFLIDNLLSADIEVIDNQIAIIVRNGAKTLAHLKASIELAQQMGKLSRSVTKVISL